MAHGVPVGRGLVVTIAADAVAVHHGAHEVAVGQGHQGGIAIAVGFGTSGGAHVLGPARPLGDGHGRAPGAAAVGRAAGQHVDIVLDVVDVILAGVAYAHQRAVAGRGNRGNAVELGVVVARGIEHLAHGHKHPRAILLGRALARDGGAAHLGDVGTYLGIVLERAAYLGELVEAHLLDVGRDVDHIAGAALEGHIRRERLGGTLQVAGLGQQDGIALVHRVAIVKHPGKGGRHLSGLCGVGARRVLGAVVDPRPHAHAAHEVAVGGHLGGIGHPALPAQQGEGNLGLGAVASVLAEGQHLVLVAQTHVAHLLPHVAGLEAARAGKVGCMPGHSGRCNAQNNQQLFH